MRAVNPGGAHADAAPGNSAQGGILPPVPRRQFLRLRRCDGRQRCRHRHPSLRTADRPHYGEPGARRADPSGRLGGDGLLRGARPDDPCGMGRRRAAPPRFLETFRGRRHNVHGAVGPPVQLQQPLRSMPHLRRIRPLPGYRRAAGDSKPGAVGIRRCRGSVAR